MEVAILHLHLPCFWMGKRSMKLTKFCLRGGLLWLSGNKLKNAVDPDEGLLAGFASIGSQCATGWQSKH